MGMAWNFTAYILWRYAERVGEEKINLTDFLNFVFVKLGRKQKVFFHDGKEDLLRDLEYLAELKLIGLEKEDTDTKIEVHDQLKNVAESLVDLSKRVKVGLMEEYLYRIDRAIDELSSRV